MEVTSSIEILNQTNIYAILKWLLEIFLIIYSVISIVVIKQIRFMTITIKSDTNKMIFFFAYFHLAVVLLLTLITAIIL